MLRGSSIGQSLDKKNLLIGCLSLLFISLSFRQTRAWVAQPLYIHTPFAKGSLAYVMSGGPASFERLHAASDLYHMGRVAEIAVLEEPQTSTYNFVTQRAETRTERCVAYLSMRGVPRERILIINRHEFSKFGSLSEARGLAFEKPNLNSLVVVTSAAHTRRCYLAFRRSMPPSTQLSSYAASELYGSDEIFSPIWIEYVKLAIYWVIA